MSIGVIFSSICSTEIISKHSTWCKTFIFTRISEWIWIYYITNHWISHNISCFLTKLVLKCPLSFLQCFTLFMAPLLLGNNQKIGLKMKTRHDSRCRKNRRNSERSEQQASVGSPNGAGGSGGWGALWAPPAGVLGGRATYENFLAFRAP